VVTLKIKRESEELTKSEPLLPAPRLGEGRLSLGKVHALR
jgi:hypothetical protein